MADDFLPGGPVGFTNNSGAALEVHSPGRHEWVPRGIRIVSRPTGGYVVEVAGHDISRLVTDLLVSVHAGGHVRAQLTIASRATEVDLPDAVVALVEESGPELDFRRLKRIRLTQRPHIRPRRPAFR